MKNAFFEKRPHSIPALIAAAFLIGALAEWPYGYYQLLRFMVCGAGVFVAYTAFTQKKIWAVWLFGFIALLFNPLIPVHLSREMWVFIDIAVGIFYLILLYKMKEKGTKKQKKTTN